MAIDRTQLIERIKEIGGLSNDERSSLLELLRTTPKYGLVWENKPEDVEAQMQDELPVFTEVKDRAIISDAPDAPNHILIEGDNLHTLTALSYTHEGKVDVIYIDPPYNTGKEDFMYNDKYVDSEDDYKHSKWLSFMYKRLYIARRLLSPTGFICISIDDNEYSQLKMLCDKVFFPENFQASFHVQVRYAEKSLNEEKPFKPLMEYVLIYSKNKDYFDPKREAVDYGLEKFCYEISELTEGEHITVNGQECIVFKPGEWEIKEVPGHIDGLKETWITGSIYTTMSYGKVFQKVVEPRVEIDGLGCLYKVLGRGDDGLGYRYYTGPARKTAKKGKMFSAIPLDKRREIETGGMPKRYLPILTAYDYAADFGNIRSEGGIPFNSGKKPIKMLENLIALHKNKGAVVLDFFAGSGSTFHAVCDLNDKDEGTRQCIIATCNENNICVETTYPRCFNVLRGWGSNEGLVNNTLRYYRTDFVPRERTQKNMRQLVAAATDLLCIKNDLYTETGQLGGRKMRPSLARHFKDGDKEMLIIYDDQSIPYIAEMLKGIEVKTPILTYVFSPNNYPYTDEFYEVADKVKLCALPAAIYDAYRKVLKKPKPRFLETETENVVAVEEDDTLGGLFDTDNEEGGNA